MKGAGTDDDTLIRLIVTRSEVVSQVPSTQSLTFSHYSTMPRPLSLWSVQTISVNARFRACERAITKPGALSNLLIACTRLTHNDK